MALEITTVEGGKQIWSYGPHRGGTTASSTPERSFQLLEIGSYLLVVHGDRRPDSEKRADAEDVHPEVAYNAAIWNAAEGLIEAHRDVLLKLSQE